MAEVGQSAEWLAKLCNGTIAATPQNADELIEAGLLLPSYHTHDAFSNNIAIIAATLYCWEYIMTVPSEIRIYFTIPWRAPHLVLFVLMRYTTAIAIGIGLYSTWHRQNGNCIAFCEVATLLVQLSVSSVLGWRTIAIWQKDARIIVIIFLLLSTLMVFSSLLVLSMKAQRLPNGICVLVQGGNYDFFPLAWFYAGTVLYDSIVIVLSTYRLWQHHNDVGVFPGANLDDTSKGDITWAEWVHSQWNSITPLLFRMTSNGVLYLAFSTVFNVVCFIIGHWSEDRAQDLMVLYSSVMWVVCQHLVLLEIKATWGDRLANDGLKDAANDETDRLISQILQASWSFKPSPANTKGPETTAETKDPEIVLSLSIDSCLKAAPKSCCGGGCSGPQPRRSQTLGVSDARRPSLKNLNEGFGESSVQQLHDFRPSVPGESFDGFGARSITNSDRAETADTNASTSVLISRHNDIYAEDKRGAGGIRQRLGALCNPNSSNKILANLTKTSRGDATTDTCLPTVEIDHPLKDAPTATLQQPSHRDSTSSRFRRISQALERVPRMSTNLATSTPATSPLPPATPAADACPCCCSCEDRDLNPAEAAVSVGRKEDSKQRIRKSASAGDIISTLEVADMLANMSDDAKTQALALAGMEGVGGGGPVQVGPSFSPTRAESKRPTWIIHPPL
ncbi:uncharacterized protein UTRI_05533_B [Ustilago trichophora]|uniref:Transmembrane protein n=1 Tax=Ustilago trichophora TaxID=86804 RepID=A0A5C3EJL5_9BASI|nr:uncharacterized protein UTRI_05533_B [Ustilago trichophora]